MATFTSTCQNLAALAEKLYTYESALVSVKDPDVVTLILYLVVFVDFNR